MLNVSRLIKLNVLLVITVLCLSHRYSFTLILSLTVAELADKRSLVGQLVSQLLDLPLKHDDECLLAVLSVELFAHFMTLQDLWSFL